MKSTKKSAGSRKAISKAALEAQRPSRFARAAKTTAKAAKPLAVVRIGRSPKLVTLLKPATKPTKIRQNTIEAAVRAVVSGVEGA